MRRTSVTSAGSDRAADYAVEDADTWKQDEDVYNDDGAEADVDFNDADDHQVFALLADGGDDAASDGSPFGKLSKGVEFRLDLSSRITPTALTMPPLATLPPKETRRASKMRSPSLLLRKSKTRRPSEPAPASRRGSIQASLSTPTPYLPVAAAPAPGSQSAAKTAIARERTRALREQVLAAQNDRESVAWELVASRSAVARLERRLSDMASAMLDLEQKLSAAEQSGELFARQLVKVNDSYHAKLVARDEELAHEKAELARDKEAELQQQHALFVKETELWKLEIGALTKSKLELEAQRAAAEVSASVCKEQLATVAGELMAAKMQAAAGAAQMTQLCQSLQEQVYALMMEKEDRQAAAEAGTTRDSSQQTTMCEDEQPQPREEHAGDGDRCAVSSNAESDRLVRLGIGLRALLGVQRGLADSVASTRATLASEADKTQRLLAALRREANELAIRQSGRDVALVARQSRIIQLEAQAKNDRQVTRELEDALAKFSRVADRKGAAASARIAEQKEHLELTLAVRRGLAAELQAKKQQLADADARARALEEGKRHSDVRAKQLQQQIAAMQLVHARELEKAVAGAASKPSAVVAAAVSRKLVGQQQVKTPRASEADTEQNNKHPVVDANRVANESDFDEFVALVAAFEAEFHDWSVRTKRMED